MGSSVPDPTVKRLSLYLRELERLAQEGRESVSSKQIADSLHIGSPKVRKDLSRFGQFGKPGTGYHVSSLVANLRRILGTQKTLNVILVGAGRLGRALLGYDGFRMRRFKLIGAFYISPDKIGKRVGGVPIHDMRQLRTVIRRRRVDLAILTVPADAAQGCAETLAKVGIGGILNFAPVTLNVPDGMAIQPVDLAAFLEQLSFQVSSSKLSGPLT